MKIKITSDSTCDLSPELVQQLDVSILPLTVIMDGQSYLDGVTITPKDIFSHVATGGALCSTAAVNIDSYIRFFTPYSLEYDAVVHINLGSGFSSCYQNARLASQEFENVYVVDSQNLSTGQGLVVLKAAQLAANTRNVEALCAQLNDYTEKVEASFLLNRLDYMVKGGRCSAVAALGANLLGLKPCIEVKGGKMSVVKKYRGNYPKCLVSYVHDRLADRQDALQTQTLFLTYTQMEDPALEAVHNAIRVDGSYFQNMYETTAGCTVSCHCGPDTLGVLFVRK